MKNGCRADNQARHPPEGKEALIKLAMFALMLAPLTGCLGSRGLLTRGDSVRGDQELKHFIAEQVTASTENIQNELWPWMVAIIIIYAVGKISGMIMYGLQQRGLKRAINGGTMRSPPLKR